MSRLKYIRLNIGLMLASGLVLGSTTSGTAAEWGYEDDAPPNAVPGSAGGVNSQSVGEHGKTAQSAELEMSPVEQWVELF